MVNFHWNFITFISLFHEAHFDVCQWMNNYAFNKYRFIRQDIYYSGNKKINQKISVVKNMLLSKSLVEI